MNIVIAMLLEKSLGHAGWDFNKLTDTEKEIIRNQRVLDEIQSMVDYEIQYCNLDDVALILED
jgi:hypothetical protein